MEVTYQHSNPETGNESFLLRAREKHEASTPCILVDAGRGVDADSLLAEDEYLAAVLLTHAHVDHYCSLADAHCDRAPIITTPDTAAILEDVLTESRRHDEISGLDSLLERVVPIEDWYDVVGGTVDVRPIPVGHTPGACGYLLRFHDGAESFSVLATGDFTLRDAAGYPGFEPEQYVGADALFLTAATDAEFPDSFTEAVGRLVRRTEAGSKTLCTASGLTGVHLAAVLGAIAETYERSIPVVLVGQVAKLYDALEYEYSNVESVPTFSDPCRCLGEGTITIAGPDVPTEGSSQRLFEALQSDPNATVVQLVSSGSDPKDGWSISGSVASVPLSNHPTESTLDEVVDDIEPSHVIIEHQGHHCSQKYKDKWDAFTWATGDRTEQTLYRDGRTVAPEWVGEWIERRVRNRERSGPFDGDSPDLHETLVCQPFERRDSLELEREGIETERLEQYLFPGSRSALEADSSPEQLTQRSAVPSGAAAVQASKPARKAPSGTQQGSRPDMAGTRGESDTGSKRRSSAVSEQAETAAVTIDAAVYRIMTHRAETTDREMPAVIDEALETFFEAVLAGSLAWDEMSVTVDGRRIDVKVDPALSRLLEIEAVTDERSPSTYLSRLVREHVTLESDERSIERRHLEPYLPWIDALTENDACPLESRSDVVQAALERDVL